MQHVQPLWSRHKTTGNMPMCLTKFRFFWTHDGHFAIFRSLLPKTAPPYYGHMRYFECNQKEHRVWCITNENFRIEDAYRAFSIGLVGLKMFTGLDLEYYFQVIEDCIGFEFSQRVRKDVEARIARMLEPLMRIRRRLFRSRCVARRWADRWWSPYTAIGQLRLRRNFAELQKDTEGFFIMHASTDPDIAS